MNSTRVIACLALSLLLTSCGTRPAAPVSPDEPKKVDLAGCENAHQLSATLFSGGDPQGDGAYRALQALGVKTLISVDGARPDVEMAAKHGMRYVHLPIGYDGIEKSRAMEISRAVRDLDGPLYLHCHHGLHRGPAAAAVALVALGTWTHEEAAEHMKRLGTSPKYEGLYGDVRELRATADDIDKADSSFPATAKLPGFAASMAHVDRSWEPLQAIKKAGWKKSPDHPDIDPPHQALQFRELVSDLNRTAYVKSKPESFRGWMSETASAASDLEIALRGADPAAADRAHARIEASCRACHDDFRNKRRPR